MNQTEQNLEEAGERKKRDFPPVEGNAAELPRAYEYMANAPETSLPDSKKHLERLVQNCSDFIKARWQIVRWLDRYTQSIDYELQNPPPDIQRLKKNSGKSPHGQEINFDDQFPPEIIGYTTKEERAKWHTLHLAFHNRRKECDAEFAQTANPEKGGTFAKSDPQTVLQKMLENNRCARNVHTGLIALVQEVENRISLKLKELETQSQSAGNGSAGPVSTHPMDSAEGSAAAPNREAEPPYVFRPDGDGFYIAGFGESGHFSARGLKGLRDLFRLVQSPGLPGVSMLELDAGPGVTRAPGDGQSVQPVYTTEGMRAIEKQRDQLKADIAQAETEMERNELQSELDKLDAEVKKGFGLRGNERDINNPNDGPRKRIWGRIRTACEKLRAGGCTQLADHFSVAVSANAGAFYAYNPAIPDLKWHTEPKKTDGI